MLDCSLCCFEVILQHLSNLMHSVTVLTIKGGDWHVFAVDGDDWHLQLKATMPNFITFVEDSLGLWDCTENGQHAVWILRVVPLFRENQSGSSFIYGVPNN